MITTRVYVFPLLLLFSLFCIGFSLFQGSAELSAHTLISAFFDRSHSLAQDILFSFRFPRTLAAFVTGALLALSGTLMQTLLRNPLADPYILGISGGSALGLFSLLFFGFEEIASLGAWAGSLFAMLAILFFMRGKHHHWSSSKLLLTGVGLASLFSTFISLILFLSPDHTLRSQLFWLVGDLNHTHFPWIEASILIIGSVWSLLLADSLNGLLLGEQKAHSLGIHIKQLQWQLFFLSSLLTAAAVSLAGCMGFVGLIIPHLMRLLIGSNHRFLLPSALLAGGSFLTLADTFSRTLFFPGELPSGMIMTLIGIPLFLFLLRRTSL